MTVFDPDKIGSEEQVDQVAARLVNAAISLPLDDFVRDLGNNPNRRLLLRNFAGRELTYARLTVRSSFLGACLAVQARWFSDLTTEQLGALSELLSSAAPQLEEASKLITRMQEAQETYQDLDFQPFRDLQQLILRVQLSIKRVAPMSKQLFVDRRQPPGNIWKIHFVGGLFQPWRELTGGTPQRNGPFVEFVESAWFSLSSNQPEDPRFESAIRTAKGRWQDCGPPEVSGPPPRK